MASLKANVASLFLVQLANYAMPLITLPWLTRTLGPDGFGRLSFCTAINAYLVLLCDFGFTANAVNKTELAWGGGYLLATGCYPIMLASWVFKGQRPVKITAHGGLGEKKTDLWASVTLEYPNAIAQLFYTGLTSTPNTASISGPKGHLRLPEFFWSPSKLVKEIQGGKSELLEFPVPGSGFNQKYNYPNSNGLFYEADHVYQCLKEGKLESDVMSLDESLLLAGIFDEIRRQLGVLFPQDD